VPALRSGVALLVLLTFCVLFGVIPFGIAPPLQASVVPSASMMPTLLPGPYIVVNRWSAGRPPARGEVIAFWSPRGDGVQFVKRVVGLPGERIAVRARSVFVNCRPGDACVPLHEPYAFYDDRAVEPADDGPVRVPSESIFVMADNRNRGEDSRDFGPIRRESVVGRPVFVYWSVAPPDGDTAFWQRVRWHRFGRIVR
jgi:signal peptidase I